MNFTNFKRKKNRLNPSERKFSVKEEKQNTYKCMRGIGLLFGWTFDLDSLVFCIQNEAIVRFHQLAQSPFALTNPGHNEGCSCHFYLLFHVFYSLFLE